MTPPRIFPSWSQIDKMTTPLTGGERTLAIYLDKYLPTNWEIYIQPYFNGDRPDIVIIHPKIGVMIFEVKDWMSNYYRSEKIKMKNHKKNKVFLYRQFYVRDSRKEWKISSPVKQVDRYRFNLISRYVPEIGESVNMNAKYLSAIKTGLYLHKMRTAEAKELIGEENKHCVVIGNDMLNQQTDIINIVPDANRTSSLSMKSDWYNKIIFWLRPPFHSIEQGTKIILNDEQKRHVESYPKQHQRLRGVAGSGKTLVLAQRAANCASSGKRVLILTYNITLWHYIKDHVSRAQCNFDWSNIEFNHFHGFCRDYLLENGIAWPDNEKTCKEDFFNIFVPSMVSKLMKRGINRKGRRYDVILIDEGQDFQKEWYQMMCLFLTENDELFFTIDEKQNIYKKDHSWVESMNETKFRGRWRNLNGCYRVPNEILEIANNFSKKFLPNVGETPVPVLVQQELFNPIFRWYNFSDNNQLLPNIVKIVNWLTLQKKIHPSDIIILLPTHKAGWLFVQFFEKNQFRVNHVFEEESTNRNNKKSFWMGDSRLKMSTVHSFKGWELNNVILLVPEKGNSTKLDYLVYTSLTRTRQNLFVFNCNQRYTEFGRNSQVIG